MGQPKTPHGTPVSITSRQRSYPPLSCLSSEGGGEDGGGGGVSMAEEIPPLSRVSSNGGGGGGGGGGGVVGGVVGKQLSWVSSCKRGEPVVWLESSLHLTFRVREARP